MMIIIEMSPMDKMKLAFDFYSHKFDDKITLQDSITVMNHYSQYDFLLQKDLKQIFKGISRAKEEVTQPFISPKPIVKTVEKAYEDSSKRGSPEKEILSSSKIVFKKKLK